MQRPEKHGLLQDKIHSQNLDLTYEPLGLKRATNDWAQRPQQSTTNQAEKGTDEPSNQPLHRDDQKICSGNQND